MGNVGSNEESRRVPVKPPPPIELSSNNKAAWEAWENAFQWYSIAIELEKLAPKIQVAVFMSALGSAVKDIFDNFGLSDEEKSNLNLVRQKFREYFAPSENEVYESYKFYTITQDDGEGIEQYITRIKVQANKCTFPATAKDRLIRDKLIHGLKSSAIREELLRKSSLTLEQTIATCKSMEKAAEHAKSMDKNNPGCSKNTESEVYTVRNGNASSSKKTAQEVVCDKCNYKHGLRKCPASGQKCNKCGNKGHFASVCKNRKKKVKQLEKESESSSDEDSDTEQFSLKVHSLSRGRGKEDCWESVMAVQKVKIRVKIDTGAQCNVITKTALQKLSDYYEIMPSRVKRLIAFNGGHVPVHGRVLLTCRIRKKMIPLWFQVVKGDRSCIIDGKSAVKAGLIARIDHFEVKEDVFEGLGTVKNVVYNAELVDNPKFVIHPARNIPFADREETKKEVFKMVDDKVTVKENEATDAVSPMVVVRRRGKIRICIDLTDVNKNIKRRHYPLTGIDQVAANVSKSRYFTILDCKKGFWQIRLSEKTSKLCTFATPWGRFRYLRMPFGLCSAPEVFQKVMIDLVGNIEGVEVSMDDILIHAPTLDKLKEITEKVIRILDSNGLKLNKEKCCFNQTSVKFLGHILSADGLSPDPEKLQAIDRLKAPTDKKSLQRFLGMITYVGKFIPNLSEHTAPLRELLKGDPVWDWTEHQQRAFLKLKNFLKNPPVLAFYDVNKPMVLSVDSSANAFGAVLMQERRPIAYATKALTDCQRNWPQIEKEAGAIRFGCQKFHDYIWGHKIVVESDHKPLETIFAKPLNKAPLRLRQILHDVKAYDLTVKYVKGTRIPIADTLSRDCSSFCTDFEEDTEELHVNGATCLTEAALERYQQATANDPALQKLRKLILEGWPDSREEVPKVIRNYFTFRDELSILDGIIFKGDQVVVPVTERQRVINDIHAGHVGIQSSLRRARDFLYWPNMTAEITARIEKCLVCEKNQRSNQKETVLMKRVPEYPFEIVALDFFTHRKREYLLIVDSFSGYYDFKLMTSSTSAAVISFLKDKFADHGIPLEVHTDGGPQFTSKEFRDFGKQWDFKHVVSSPYFARSNGLAERYVQTAKNLLKKCREDGQDIKLALLMSRNTPGNELRSPAERLFSRKTRNPLCMNRNLLVPKIAEDNSERLQEQRNRQKKNADMGAKSFDKLAEGTRVRVQERDNAWVTGTIQSQQTERSYNVQLDDGRLIRRNRHFLHETKVEKPILPPVPASLPVSPTPARDSSSCNTSVRSEEIASGVPTTPEMGSPVLHRENEMRGTLSDPLATPVAAKSHPDPAPSPVPPAMITTRSGRVIKPPDRLNL
ncbi:uncharacterized protein K02A2.6-like [Phlebotomus papatasi]|uniref:uncharacterized protein K02A2.6-like n=1 Tax=Phlebotomus papatasi TaxID=29031 RepID=UPI0024842C1C|nr:uncharacterized protein K02A2.6-like [Phlebotomus papatasi]